MFPDTPNDIFSDCADEKWEKWERDYVRLGMSLLAFALSVAPNDLAEEHKEKSISALLEASESGSLISAERFLQVYMQVDCTNINRTPESFRSDLINNAFQTIKEYCHKKAT